MLEITLNSGPDFWSRAGTVATVATAVAALLSPWIALIIGNRQNRNARELADKQLEAASSAAEDQARSHADAVDRQIRATVVSTSRQQWLDAIRSDVAELISTHEATERLVHKSAFVPLSDEDHELANSRSDTRMMLFTRIRLRLNPEEPLHTELLQALGDLKDGGYDEGGRRAALVVDAVDPITRQVWGLVKQGL